MDDMEATADEVEREIAAPANPFSEPPATIAPPILVVDVETSGLDPERHSIIELGASWLHGPRAGARWEMECGLWDGAEWDPEVEAVHDRSRASCENPMLPTEGDLVEEFIEWLGRDFDFLLAGLNPAFDRRFLLAAAGRAARELPITHRTLDLHTLAVAEAIRSATPIPPRGLPTDELYDFLGLPPEPRPHRALCGVECESEAFELLLS